MSLNLRHFSLCRKEEVPILMVMVLALATTIFFMRGGGSSADVTAQSEVQGKELLWVRHYLTNLQSGSVNEMAVDSLRESKESVIPVLVQEMSVRPPTIGKRLNDRVEKILAQFPSMQRPRNVPDGYRVAATWALAMIFRGPQEEGYRAATSNETRTLLPVIAHALYDHAVMVRAHAAGALGAFVAQLEDVRALCDEALKDSEWMVRANVLSSVAALAKMDAEAMKMVERSLDDSHPEVRRRARAILVMAGFPVPEGKDEGSAVTSAYYFE